MKKKKLDLLPLASVNNASLCGLNNIFSDSKILKVKLDSKVDRERLLRIELKQYENRQVIKSVERVERKEIK